MTAKTLAVKVELPVDWFLNPIDGDRHRIFMANLLAALTKCAPSIEVVKVPWGSDFAERSPPPNGVLFSYHSVGRVPGVLRLKEAPIPPLYSIDRGGHSGWSQIANSRAMQERARAFDLEAANRIIESYRERFKETRLSKYPQSEIAEELPDRYVFVPLQLPNDPVSLYASIDSISLLTEAARVAEETKTHVVVKRHPFCKSIGIETCIADLVKNNRYFRVTTGNVHDLIEKSMSVLTVNSGVGLEALIHGKPVYSCGKSEWQPASHAVPSVEGIKNAFREEQPEMSDEAKSYVGFLLSEYWVDSTDFGRVLERVRQRIAEAFEPFDIDGPLEEPISPLQEAAKLGDLQRNFSQLQADLDFVLAKSEKSEAEVIRLTEMLNDAQKRLLEQVESPA